MDSGGSGLHPVFSLSPTSPTAITRGSKQRSHAQMADLRRPPISLPGPASTRSNPLSPRQHRIALPPLVPGIRSPFGMPPPPLSSHRRGFDHRRPISTTSNLPTEPDVVDLTVDDEAQEDEDEEGYFEPLGNTRVHEFNRPSHQTRMPRFGRDIIEVLDDPSPTQPANGSSDSPRQAGSRRRTPYRDDRMTPTLRRASSSDIVHMNQRRRDNSRRMEPNPDPPTPSPPRLRHYRHNGMTVNEVDLTVSDSPEEDVVFVSSTYNPDPPSPIRPPGRNIHISSDSDAEPSSASAMNVSEFLWQTMRNARNMTNPSTILQHRFSYFRQGGTGQFVPPAGLDYITPSFTLGIDPVEEMSRAATYQPPPAPDEGFTRTPTEAEEVVCPSCGDALAYGETDVKRQVWVVRSCGHVYCGQCIANRSKSKAKAMGKARAFDGALRSPTPRFFSECVVDGCKSNVKNKSSVFQIFL